MKKGMKTFGQWLTIGAITLLMATTNANAQQMRQFLTPKPNFGIGFNADTNHPIFSGSLRVMMELGMPSDYIKFNIGAGYRGYFDRNPPHEFIRNATFSDYLLYSDEYGHSKNVRPVGGQVIIPAEVYLRLINLGDDAFISLGCGAEYGIRLYQSDRYARYYGDHILNDNSFSFYPMITIEGDIEDVYCSASLYWRHNAKSPFNYKNLYDSKKFDALNFFGFQLTVGIPL